MEKLKICLVGCGRISFKHAEAYANNYDQLEVVGFCDLDSQKALRTRQKYYELLATKGIEIKKGYTHIYRLYKDVKRTRM